MLWAVTGALAGACIGFGRWKYRSVRVHGRFFPYEGSARDLVVHLMLYGTILALAFFGAGVLNEDAARYARQAGQDAATDTRRAPLMRAPRLQEIIRQRYGKPAPSLVAASEPSTTAL